MLIDIKVIFRIINIILIVILSYFTTKFVLLSVEQKLETKTQMNLSSSKIKAVKKDITTISDYDVILKRNIFNSKDTGDAELNASSILNKSENNLSNITGTSNETTFSDYWLRGVVYTGGNDSVAILETKNQRKQIVAGVGDEISFGVKLIEVRSRSVLLARGKQHHELQIHREQSIRTASMRGYPHRKGITRRSDRSFVIGRSTLSKSLENVNDIITQVAMRPKLQNGACIGYEVRRIKKGSIFEDIGLHKGDILQSVNGMNLSNPEDAFRVYKSLVGETSFNIDLLRDGSKTTLSYEVR